nr:hypothetical protein [Tanacetum cinerariifolium]
MLIDSIDKGPVQLEPEITAKDKDGVTDILRPQTVEDLSLKEKLRKRRAFWSLNEDILKIIDSDIQYAVSIKEDTAYLCPHSPKTTKETSKRRAFWSLNEDILKIIDSDIQYAVSIKEDTAYLCPHSPKTTKETRKLFAIEQPISLASPTDSEYLCSVMRYMIHNEVACLILRSGKIQKAKKKSLIAKGKGKANGNRKDKQVYISKPKYPKPYAKEHPAKYDACHHCKEVGHWKRNCPVYLAELLKKKKQVGSASFSNDIYEIDMHDLVPNVNSIYNVSTKRAKHNLDSTYLWHCRLARISKKHIEKLQKEVL